jgi:hypothetical protein
MLEAAGEGGPADDQAAGERQCDDDLVPKIHVPRRAADQIKPANRSTPTISMQASKRSA